MKVLTLFEVSLVERESIAALSEFESDARPGVALRELWSGAVRSLPRVAVSACCVTSRLGDLRGSADTPAVPLSATTPKLPASSE
jgi:hypothetical protein